MITWGASGLHHDASISVVKGDKILFAGHAERYSKIKNDPFLNKEIVAEALKYGKPSEVVWYENPWYKRARYVYSGQYRRLLENPKSYMRGFLPGVKMHYIDHHKSHAAAGYMTSNFQNAAIIVADAIGEWTTLSVWQAKGSLMKCIHKMRYPNSIGLLYSAFTKLCGLKPNEEEYILMGMAAYDEPLFKNYILNQFVLDKSAPNFTLKENVHRGIKHSFYKILVKDETNKFRIAASIQSILEDYLCDLAYWAKNMTQSRNLILMGGVALNCVANTKIADMKLFDDIWIMPNPGDAGSSLGAVAAYQNHRIVWDGPYLGTNIDRELDIDQLCSVLERPGKNGIAGVANGRAEFGPRALGNRSLLANPTQIEIKDAVNEIKKRQKFRPFAPAILEEHAKDYFVMPFKKTPYMQYAVKCRQPDQFPAICHVDLTSRVQTVSQNDNPKFYELLTEFHRRTGCPMLLNTSLNIKGMPLVNDWMDAQSFAAKYNVPVF